MTAVSVTHNAYARWKWIQVNKLPLSAQITVSGKLQMIYVHTTVYVKWII